MFWCSLASVFQQGHLPDNFGHHSEASLFISVTHWIYTFLQGVEIIRQQIRWHIIPPHCKGAYNGFGTGGCGGFGVHSQVTFFKSHVVVLTSV